MGITNTIDCRDESKIKSVFVDRNDRIAIVCPTCGKCKILTVDHFPRQWCTYNIRCSCSHHFKIKIEYRKAYRKKTNLSGTLKADYLEEDCITKIRDLSQNGICLEVPVPDAMQINQHGTVIFTLDDKKGTQLIKQFTVRSILGNWIGCEFIKDRAYEKDLGFYLRI